MLKHGYAIFKVFIPMNHSAVNLEPIQNNIEIALSLKKKKKTQTDFNNKRIFIPYLNLTD